MCGAERSDLLLRGGAFRCGDADEKLADGDKLLPGQDRLEPLADPGDRRTPAEEHPLERLDASCVGRVEKQLGLEETRDLVDFALFDLSIGGGDEHSELEHQCGSGVSGTRRQAGRLPRFRPEQGDQVVPAIGPLRDPDVGLDDEADGIGRPGQ